MRLDILGPRLLLRRYEAPERSAGGIIIPENWRLSYDGKIFEVEAVGRAVNLCVVGTMGPKLVPAIGGDFGGTELSLQKDDIVQLRGGGFRGVWAGPELRRALGYDCWFVDVEETIGDGLSGKTRKRCIIEWVWPASAWQEAA